MISKSISVSEQVNELSDFAALLFSWMIPHANDYGVISGSSKKIKAMVMPMRSQNAMHVEKALQEIFEQQLIWLYEINGEKFIQFREWEKHQQGLQKRTKSDLPLYCENSLNASEADIETFLVTGLLDGNILLNSSVMVSVERQVRINNSYLDIVCREGECCYLIEVKRSNLSNASLQQIINYSEQMKKQNINCVNVLIGHGLANNIDLELAVKNNVNIFTYDETLITKQITISDVNPCEITLITNRTKPNLIEPKRKEKKIKEVKSSYAEFVTMTEEEHRKIIEQYGAERVKRMINILDNYKGSNGKKYDSDYRAILNWVVKREEEENNKYSTGSSEFDRVNQPTGPKQDCPRCKGTGSYETRLPRTDIEKELGIEGTLVTNACRCGDLRKEG